jgi:hypothetical protein
VAPAIELELGAFGKLAEGAVMQMREGRLLT